MFTFGGEIYEEEDIGEEDWDISRLLARYVSDCDPIGATASCLVEEEC